MLIHSSIKVLIHDLLDLGYIVVNLLKSHTMDASIRNLTTISFKSDDYTFVAYNDSFDILRGMQAFYDVLRLNSFTLDPKTVQIGLSIDEARNRAPDSEKIVVVSLTQLTFEFSVSYFSSRFETLESVCDNVRTVLESDDTESFGDVNYEEIWNLSSQSDEKLYSEQQTIKVSSEVQHHQRLKNIHDGIRQYWSIEKNKIKNMWKLMNYTCRKHFFQTFCPTLPESIPDPHCLMPEMNLQDLTKGFYFISLLDYWAECDICDLAAGCLIYVRGLLNANRLVKPFPYDRFKVGRINPFEGEIQLTEKVTGSRLTASQKEVIELFDKLIEGGLASSNVEYYYILKKMDMSMLTIASAFDEIRSAVQKTDKPNKIGMLTFSLKKYCGNCSKIPDESMKFAICSRCRMISYCSIECQKDHWKSKHKVECATICDKMRCFK